MGMCDTMHVSTLHMGMGMCDVMYVSTLNIQFAQRAGRHTKNLPPVCSMR